MKQIIKNYLMENVIIPEMEKIKSSYPVIILVSGRELKGMSDIAISDAKRFNEEQREE